MAHTLPIRLLSLRGTTVAPSSPHCRVTAGQRRPEAGTAGVTGSLDRPLQYRAPLCWRQPHPLLSPHALLLFLHVFPVDRMSHVFECCHLGRCLLQRLRLTRRSTRRSQLSFVTVWGRAPPRAPASSSRRAAAPQHQASYARHLLRHGPSRVTILSTRLRQRSPTLSCRCHPAATLPYLPPTLLPHHPITNLLLPLP